MTDFGRHLGGRALESMVVLALALLSAGSGAALAAQEIPVDRSSETSLDSLLNVRVQAASRYEQEARWAPSSLTIVTEEMILSRGYATLADILQDVPGFYTTYDRDYTYVGVRGFGRPTDWNNRVLVLLDGHPMNEGVYFSIAVGTELGQSLRGVERVEILRGPGSALYGTSAMFAVVNLVTKVGGDVDGASFSAEVASFGARSLSVVAGERLANGVEFAVSGDWGRTEGQDLYFPEFAEPSTNDGVASGVDWESYAKATATASFQGLVLTARFASREKGIPTAAWGTAFNDSRARVVGDWGSVHARYTARPSATTELLVGASFDVYRFHGVYPGDEGAPFENSTNAKGVDAEAQLTWDVAPAYRVILGTELTRYLRADYSDKVGDTHYFDDNFPYTVGSAYAQVEAHLVPGLALTAGLRHDDYSYAGTATTPRLALIAAPNRNSVVKLLWGTAFRAPNIYEQFVVTAQQSRPSLDPETIESWELTGERRLGGDLLAQASIYHYAVEQLIDLQEDPEGGSNWFANLGRVHTLGGEVGLVYRAERTQGALSYGHAAASDAESGDRLSNSPRHVAKGSATFRLPADFAVTWTQRFESGRLTVYGTRTEAYSVASLTVRKVELIGGASVLAQVRNLFDTVYATPGGFEHRQARIPQDGRALVLRVDWAF